MKASKMPKHAKKSPKKQRSSAGTRSLKRKESAKIPCTDCGKLVHMRGLASHRNACRGCKEDLAADEDLAATDEDLAQQDVSNNGEYLKFCFWKLAVILKIKKNTRISGTRCNIV